MSIDAKAQGAEPREDGRVYVEVSGLTGTGKSAVMGEIEIAMKALGLNVETDAAHQAEKNGTHADWQSSLDLYRPTVVLTERNVSRSPAPAAPTNGGGEPVAWRSRHHTQPDGWVLLKQPPKLDDPYVITEPLYAALPPHPSQQGGTERSGVYVASRASIPERGQMWRDLRASGVNVTSSWIDEDGPGETADFADLWPRIEREVTSSEQLICYLEPDDFPIKGVLIEIGMALAAKVPVVIVAPDIDLEGRTFRPLGSWIKHPLVSFAPTILAALNTSEARG